MVNLAVNAKDAMDGRGQLTISVSRIQLSEDDARWPGLEPGDYVRLVVQDSGRGMSADDMEHACEPFFSTKTSSVGTGLGLSMVYGFMKQSGGDLGIDSKPGHGTSVTMMLPEHLLTDIVMPGSFDGRELADWVERNHPHVRVLMMTGFDGPRPEDPASETDRPLLTKPFSRIAEPLRQPISPSTPNSPVPPRMSPCPSVTCP